MKLIGIAGKKYSGKDTLAKLMLEYDPSIFVTHFADRLKDEIASICDVSREQIDQNKELFRPMLQWWGTEYRKRFCNNENYWINSLHESIQDLPCPVVVSDVRFPSEAEYIRSQGGILIKIIRPGLESSDNHLSETALDTYQEWDKIVVNDCLVNLHMIAGEIVKEFILSKEPSETSQNSSPVVLDNPSVSPELSQDSGTSASS